MSSSVHLRTNALSSVIRLISSSEKSSSVRGFSASATAVYGIEERNGTHALGANVTVSVKLPAKAGADNRITLFGAYYDGESREYIEPDLEALAEGYIQFDTPHFSRFTPVKLTKEQAMKQYAARLAEQQIAEEAIREKLKTEMTDSCIDTLDRMGIGDADMRRDLSAEALNSPQFEKTVQEAPKGSTEEFKYQTAQNIGAAVLNFALKLKTRNTYGVKGMALLGAIDGIEKAYNGDYSGAMKGVVASALECYPVVRGMKAAYTVCQAAKNIFCESSMEHAYNLYLNSDEFAGMRQGQSVEILYKPKNPKLCSRPSRLAPKIVKAAAIPGAASAAVGIAMYLLGYFGVL